MTQADDLFAAGVDHHHAGRLNEAEKAYFAVLKVEPGHIGALSNLGRIARVRGDVDGALRHYRAACSGEAAPAEVFFNLANTLRDTGDTKGAIREYERALRINPSLAPARNALEKLRPAGQTRAERTRLAEQKLNEGDGDAAVALLRQIVQENPEDATALQNLGYLFRSTGHYRAALNCYDQASRLSDDLMIRVEMANCMVNIGAFAKARRELEKLIVTPQGRRAATSSYLMSLLYDPAVSARFICDEHVRLTSEWKRRKTPENKRGANDRVRVVYLTADFFGSHPVSQFLAPVLRAHADLAIGVESFAYISKPRADDTARQMSALVAARSIDAMDDEAAARLIRSDNIDLLIDLSGHTSGRRLSLLGLRPAPVQACFIGYPSTTGFGAVDWLIGDWRLFPAGAEEFYAEKLARLPDAFLAFAPPVAMPPPRPRRAEGPVTFGSLNHLPKMNADVVRVWAEILNGAPGSRLFLQCAAFAEPETCEEIRRSFAAKGIAKERLTLSPPQPFHEAMKRYHEIDIALDPFPYNGGTTTAHALWMGVPVVSLTGDYFCRRMGESLLHAAGAQAHIAKDQCDYVRIAVDLADDIAGGRDVRGARLDANAGAPLFDTDKYARDLAVLYKQLVS
ncbi:MAG: tetratricopeptide repeat protein [Parvularculaceae bacterium]|nr:tetratricopeptide repeat protein [Parvularculaceae bacterium]